MTLIVFAAACATLSAAFVRLNILILARDEVFSIWRAVAALRAADWSDQQKEAYARGAALCALAGFSRLFLRLGAVACATLAPIWIADAIDLVPSAAVAAFALRLDVAAATTIGALAAFFLFNRRASGRG